MGSFAEFHYGYDEEEENAEDNEMDVGDATGHTPREKENDHNMVKRNDRVPRNSQLKVEYRLQTGIV